MSIILETLNVLATNIFRFTVVASDSGFFFPAAILLEVFYFSSPMHTLIEMQLACPQSHSLSTTVQYMTQSKDGWFPITSPRCALFCHKSFTEAFVIMGNKGKWTWWISFEMPCLSQL